MSLLSTYKEILPSAFTFPMRLIPGGSFDMGSADTETDAYSPEMPLRKGLKIEQFYLAPYLVTQNLWKTVMGETNDPAHFKGDQLPVETVSWEDAQVFIKALNLRTEINRQGVGLGEYRLPTEAEWEYAARGGPFNSIYRYAGSDKLKEVGWYGDNSDKETHEIGLLMPNQLGLYDMSGNVWEWLEDHWHENYYNAPKDGRAWLNIAASNKGVLRQVKALLESDDNNSPFRVLRGGGYFDVSQRCRSTYRYYLTSDYRNDFIGFRLALSPSLGQSTPAIL